MTREQAKQFVNEFKRYEVYAGNENESGLVIMGTAHSVEERENLVEKARQQGFDFVEYIEY